MLIMDLVDQRLDTLLITFVDLLFIAMVRTIFLLDLELLQLSPNTHIAVVQHLLLLQFTMRIMEFNILGRRSLTEVRQMLVMSGSQLVQ